MNPTRPQILIGSIDADYYLLVIRILESEGYQVILRSGGWGNRPSRMPIPMKPPLCSEMIAPPVSGMISPPV
ncbi:hypothetical protein CN221_38110 [Sinorhizobium meliloti]|nr:hypothetical protein CN221_38110 [Sinorhizobium meliloti]RVH41807.1 hypothetical protein CN213_37245 [Sinorhizobium meliloti]RVH50991.1 hypothetical protein CN209_38150 [Sinorhizobium meliloti]RVH64180.1 hypothetical protein CN203_37555 [Sinorhizobium meliloti]RVH93287.1 hypothetical protein CN206_36580 [Sinorhizobium meliloti]